MKHTFENIREPLRKVLEVVWKDRKKLWDYSMATQETPDKTPLNVMYLERAICNHMCDSNPELFGISQDDAYAIRDYFNSTGFGHDFRDYLLFCHRDFPQFMEPEEDWFIADTNKERERKGSPPIQIDSLICNV